MNLADVQEIKIGKEWLENIISQSKSLTIPPNLHVFKRRIQQLHCNTIFYKITSPKISKVIFRYILGTFYISWILTKSIFSRKKVLTSFSIWDSDIDSHVTVDDFNTFLDSKQIIEYKNEKFVFVKSLSQKKLFKNAAYIQNPIYEIVSYIKVSPKDLFTVTIQIILNFFTFIKVITLFPETTGIFKDFLTEPVLNLYKKRGLYKLYRTNSLFNNQEYWCENLNFNTVWYSINSRAIQYKNISKTKIPECPLYYFEYFGTSITWNQSHANWLKNLYNHEVEIVGPIMFYFLSNKGKFDQHEKRIIIFDVTPCEEDYVRSQVAQKGFNYYNEDICIKFISDILEASDNTNCSIYLKPKRAYANFHSKKYINFLETIQSQKKNFKILSPKSNLFDEIQLSDVVITIPFSSPFDIARSLNIPTIYYDSSTQVDFEYMGYSNDDYAIDIASLRDKLVRLVK